MNYAEAQKIMATARNRETGKPLENNTRLKLRATHYTIRLYDTDIFDIFPNGSYRLRTGGFQTQTTKARLNQYLPPGFCVYSENRKWLLQRTPGGPRGYSDYEFKEEMTIGPRGGVSTRKVREGGKCER